MPKSRHFPIGVLCALLMGACGSGQDELFQARIVEQQWKGFAKNSGGQDQVSLSIVLEVKNSATVPIKVDAPLILATEDGSPVMGLRNPKELWRNPQQPREVVTLKPGEVVTWDLLSWQFETRLGMNPSLYKYHHVAKAGSLYLHHHKMQERIPISPLPALEEIVLPGSRERDSALSAEKGDSPVGVGLIVTGCTCNIYRNGVIISSTKIPVGASCLGKLCSGN